MNLFGGKAKHEGMIDESRKRESQNHHERYNRADYRFR